RGRPTKQQNRNISGLRNQKPRTPSPTPEPAAPEPVLEREYSPDWPSELPSDDEDELPDLEYVNLAEEDGMRSGPQSQDGDDSDIQIEDEWESLMLEEEMLDDEVFLEKLLSQAEQVGDDADEEDWVPARVRYQRQRRKEERTARGKYKKGPDVANQTKLKFGRDFLVNPAPPRAS
ncbi:hypothetical protein R3P38DRAFT_3522094, partial [Favolaschia claudopus]